MIQEDWFFDYFFYDMPASVQYCQLILSRLPFIFGNTLSKSFFRFFIKEICWAPWMGQHTTLSQGFKKKKKKEGQISDKAGFESSKTCLLLYCNNKLCAMFIFLPDPSVEKWVTFCLCHVDKNELLVCKCGRKKKKSSISSSSLFCKRNVLIFTVSFAALIFDLFFFF